MDFLINVLAAVLTLGILAAVTGAVLGFLGYEEGKAKKNDRRAERDRKKKRTSLRAFVKCNGQNCEKRYTYVGAEDCNVAMLLAGGPNVCKYSCLGLGSCASVCPENAISIESGIAVVSEEKCNGCGKCVEVCSRGVIELVPENSKYRVQCSNTSSGEEVQKSCEAGCIGCFICADTCKYEAVIKKENLAAVDYDKCTDCGECAKACPRTAIMGPQEKNTDTFDESEYFSIEISEEN